jgi:hypothetical protein
LNETTKKEAETQISKRKSFEEGDDFIVRDYSTTDKNKWMQGNIILKIEKWMYKVNVKGNTVRRHMNQIRNYSKKQLEV